MTLRPQPPPSRAASLPLVGGELALDFCNTSSGRNTPGHVEHLRGWADLLRWARHAGILDDGAEARLSRMCEDDAGLGQRLFDRALSLREAIYSLDSALASHDPVRQADIDGVAGVHAACLTKGRLTSRNGGFGWTWPLAEAPEEAVLGPIAASAMLVLTAADRARLKQCTGHHCGWLFLDTTKNNRRRWCEMEVCGNRAKQMRLRNRLRAEPQAER